MEERGRLAEFYNGPISYASGSDHLHVGVFRTPEDDFGDAKAHLVELVCGELAVGAGERLIDVGCGIGAPAIAIGRARRCSIAGVTLVDEQARQAQRDIAAAGLERLVTVMLANAHRLPFAEGAFDAAVAIESLLHMNRAQALAEIRRVVRPGGQIVLSDWIVRAPLNPRLIDDLKRYVLMTSVTLDDYRRLLAEAGFSEPRVLDWSEAVQPSYDRWELYASHLDPSVPEDFAAFYRDVAARVLPILRQLGYMCLAAVRQ